MESQAQAKQERRFGWKSYAFMALAAAVAASKFRKQLRRPSVSTGGQSEARWYTASEADARQEHLDEMEHKERVARMQEAYGRLKSNYRNMNTANRYQKWEEHPSNENEDSVKDKLPSDYAERSKLRQHYIILGLNPFRDEAFTEEEIKAAFRERARQFHPDKNPDNKEEMRAKFRDVVDSYKVIKAEKKIS